MDFITECFAEYEQAFSEHLQRVGFDNQQVSAFLPEAINGIINSTGKLDIEGKINELLSSDPSRIFACLDKQEISQKLSIPPHKVNAGLKSIAPLFSQVISSKGDGLVAAASLAWGAENDFNGSAKKLFG